MLPVSRQMNVSALQHGVATRPWESGLSRTMVVLGEAQWEAGVLPGSRSGAEAHGRVGMGIFDFLHFTPVQRGVGLQVFWLTTPRGAAVHRAQAASCLLLQANLYWI